LRHLGLVVAEAADSGQGQLQAPAVGVAVDVAGGLHVAAAHVEDVGEADFQPPAGGLGVVILLEDVSRVGFVVAVSGGGCLIAVGDRQQGAERLGDPASSGVFQLLAQVPGHSRLGPHGPALDMHPGSDPEAVAFEADEAVAVVQPGAAVGPGQPQAAARGEESVRIADGIDEAVAREQADVVEARVALHRFGLQHPDQLFLVALVHPSDRQFDIAGPGPHLVAEMVADEVAHAQADAVGFGFHPGLDGIRRFTAADRLGAHVQLHARYRPASQIETQAVDAQRNVLVVDLDIVGEARNELRFEALVTQPLVEADHGGIGPDAGAFAPGSGHGGAAHPRGAGGGVEFQGYAALAGHFPGRRVGGERGRGQTERSEQEQDGESEACHIRFPPEEWRSENEIIPQQEGIGQAEAGSSGCHFSGFLRTHRS